MDSKQFLLTISMYCSPGRWANLEKFIDALKNNGFDGVSVTDYYRIKSHYPGTFIEKTIDEGKKQILVFPSGILSVLVSLGFQVTDSLHAFIKKEKLSIPGMETVKIKKTRNGFVPPTIEEITGYMQLVTNSTYFTRIEAPKFFDFYSSRGWMVGSKKMVDWKASARLWTKSSFQKTRIIPDGQSATNNNEEFKHEL